MGRLGGIEVVEPLVEALSDENSQVFMLELPYELQQFLDLNRTVKLTLPDNRVRRLAEEGRDCRRLATGLSRVIEVVVSQAENLARLRDWGKNSLQATKSLKK